VGGATPLKVDVRAGRTTPRNRIRGCKRRHLSRGIGAGTLVLMRWTFIGALALLLGACGSADGEENGGDAGDPAPFGVSGPFNDATQKVGGSSETCIDGEFQCAVFEIVNEERAKVGLPPYKYNPDLATAAQDHARDMQQQDYFSHSSQDGRSFSDRVDETAYSGFASGENIALGQRDPESVMSSWMSSDGHRANILSEGSDEIGIGFVDNYWVQVFGRGGE